MSANNYNDDRNTRPQAPKGARIAFGILMICVYIGMGILFCFNIFTNVSVFNYIVGGLLCLYGVYRGYRLYKGIY